MNDQTNDQGPAPEETPVTAEQPPVNPDNGTQAVNTDLKENKGIQAIVWEQMKEDHTKENNDDAGKEEHVTDIIPAKEVVTAPVVVEEKTVKAKKEKRPYVKKVRKLKPPHEKAKEILFAMKFNGDDLAFGEYLQKVVDYHLEKGYATSVQAVLKTIVAFTVCGYWKDHKLLLPPNVPIEFYKPKKAKK